MATMFETSVLGRTATALRRQREGIAALRGAVPPRRLLHPEVRELGIALTRPLQNDINWSDGMGNAWRRIRDDDRVIASVTVDRRVGFCLVGPSRTDLKR